MLTEVRRAVAQSGVFWLDDLIPLPCNPDQSCIGYGLRSGEQGDADHFTPCGGA